jgi:ribosomal protein S18 acetylase RimI-like enzyme
MRIRELKREDGPQVLRFLKTEFPTEEAVLGTRPEGFEEIFRRVFRWDARLILGTLRLFGRSPFHFFVVEEDGRIVATTILSFSGPTGYLSMVVVDPAYRRRGYAQALLERARTTALRSRRQFVALDVLVNNAPARTLYERVGYRPLRSTSFLAHDDATVFSGARPPSGIREFRSSDARAIVTVARQGSPPEVEKVLPTDESMIRGSRLANRVLISETAAWVVDRGRGPEGWIRGVVSQATEAGHFAAPIVGPSVEPELALDLVRTAGAWCASRGVRRLATEVPESNLRGRAALEGGGFHEAFQTATLYRSAT